MLRMSAIGLGITMMLLAGINLYALHALVDASVENQLGFSASELRPLFHVLAAIGFLLMLLGFLVRLPESWKMVPARPRSRRARRRIGAKSDLQTGSKPGR